MLERQGGALAAKRPPRRLALPFFWVRGGLKQTPPRGSVTTTLLIHGTILVRQALEKIRVLARFLAFKWLVIASPVY